MRNRSAVLIAVGLICAGYGSLYAADTLEKAIEKQAGYIIKNAPRNTALAIVNVKSNSAMLSEYIMEKLPDYVVNTSERIIFVDRSKLDLIQQEINFQYSGEVSDDQVVAIGRKIGAKVIVTGAVLEVGREYSFNIKLLDVETAQILGSNSQLVVHDATMDGFMSGSRVAQLALEDAQRRRREREAAVSTIKKALGIFSHGVYLGYLGSLTMPIGLSFGGTSEGVRMFIETGFSPPDFAGHEHSGGLSYSGNTIQNPAQGAAYVNLDDRTAFVWDVNAGFNINIIKTLLWATIGAGFEYRQDYKLFTETSTNGSGRIWAKSEADDQLKALISAGLYVKLWYFYIQGKYRYVIGEEIDASTYGLNHLSLGLGYVWRME